MPEADLFGGEPVTKVCTVLPDGECAEEAPCLAHHCTEDECCCQNWTGRPRGYEGPPLPILMDASALVASLMDTLDQSQHPCPTCSLNVRDNKNEFQAHLELTAVRKKLEKWAWKLGGKK